MNNPELLGRVVKFHRRQSGLSQLALADLAGVGKTVIFDLEKGKMTVRFDTLLKVLKALNITISLKSPLMHLFEESVDEKS
jgi:HTH-type transcriptional regulator/antitoxin HipB